MLTASERVGRCLEVLRDAFSGQPTHLEQDPEEPNVWVGHILGEKTTDPPRFTITLEDHPWDGYLVGTIEGRDGQKTHRVLRNYESAAEWVYTHSRVHGLQEWLSPAHFVHLVNLIFEPEPAVAFNASWPHDHRVEIRPGVELSCAWDEDLCRLVAHVRGGGRVLDTLGFQKPEEALGWLTDLRVKLEGSKGPSTA